MTPPKTVQAVACWTGACLNRIYGPHDSYTPHQPGLIGYGGIPCRHTTVEIPVPEDPPEPVSQKEAMDAIVMVLRSMATRNYYGALRPLARLCVRDSRARLNRDDSDFTDVAWIPESERSGKR